jgi:hypothetical protein
VFVNSTKKIKGDFYLIDGFLAAYWHKSKIFNSIALFINNKFVGRWM